MTDSHIKLPSRYYLGWALAYLNKNAKRSYSEIAKFWGFDKSERGYVSGLIRDYKKSRENRNEYESVFEMHADGSHTSDRLIWIIEEDTKSPTRLLEMHGFDPERWEMTYAKNNMWHMQKSHKVGGGKVLCYQSKITARPKGKGTITFDDVDKFFEDYKIPAQSKTKTMLGYTKNGHVLEIDLYDLHAGMQPAHGEENKMAERFKHAINTIYFRVKERKLKLSKIVIIPGGDIAHIDTFKKTTTAGTQVDTDKDFDSIFEEATGLFIWAIDMLSMLAPVEVKLILGNHDYMFGYFIIKSLQYYFKDNKNVVIDCERKSRKFDVFGVSLVGWTHGDMSKKNIGGWLQVEAKKEWGETKFAEVHAGHIHHQVTTEANGVIVRHLPTMAQTDNWHYDKGFIGNVSSTASFLWNLETGLEEMWFANV